MLSSRSPEATTCKSDPYERSFACFMKLLTKCTHTFWSASLTTEPAYQMYLGNESDILQDAYMPRYCSANQSYWPAVSQRTLFWGWLNGRTSQFVYGSTRCTHGVMGSWWENGTGEYTLDCEYCRAIVYKAKRRWGRVVGRRVRPKRDSATNETEAWPNVVQKRT